jgi:hypothetical protein
LNNYNTLNINNNKQQQQQQQQALKLPPSIPSYSKNLNMSISGTSVLKS